MHIATAHLDGQYRPTNAMVPESQAWRSSVASLLYLRIASRGLHQAVVSDAMRGAGAGGSIERLTHADADECAVSSQPLLQGHGYAAIGPPRLLPDRVPVWVMWRPPSAADVR
jgi:hypothetical protein